jgi:hypothetical protein
MKVFLIHVRYCGALMIAFTGAVLLIPGECLLKLARWIGSKE